MKNSRTGKNGREPSTKETPGRVEKQHDQEPSPAIVFQPAPQVVKTCGLALAKYYTQRGVAAKEVPARVEKQLHHLFPGLSDAAVRS